MSDNPEYFHAEDPARAQESEDFSPDFFSDVADPSSVPDASPHGSAPALASETPYEPYPTSHAAEVESSPGAPVFPVILGILMVAVVGASLFINRAAKETKESTPTPAVAETPAPTDLLSGDVKSLKGEIEKLAGQLKDLSAKVDGLPKPPPPDLKPIQAKLDDLTKSVASVEGVGGKLDKIDAQVKSLDGVVKSANDKVAALSADVKKAADDAAKAMTVAASTPVAATPTPAATTTKPEEDKSATAFAEGADLFKAKKYKEADDVFKKLADANPKDARVYYYAALTDGLTTNGWQTSAVKIATRGAELEKSGETKPADVDAAFSGLPDNLKPWLDYFRKLAK